MKISSWLKVMGGLLLVLSLLNWFSVSKLENGIAQERLAVQRQAQFKQLGLDLKNASDYLTEEMRRYVQFGDKQYYDHYWKEVNETKSRDKVVEQLKALQAPQEELDLIEKAKNSSDTLIKTEEAAMKAVEEKNFDSARKLMFGEQYDASKKEITGYIQQFQTKMNTRAQQEADAARQTATSMMSFAVILLVITFLVLFGIFTLILIKLRPLKTVNEKIAELAGNGGDLTARLTSNTKDEIGEIAGSLNRMLDSLHGMIKEITGTSEKVWETSEKLIANTKQTSAATEEIGKRMAMIKQGAVISVQNTLDGSRAIEEMAKGVQRVAESATELSGAAVDTEKEAVDGYGHMEQAKQQMDHIDESVNQSARIVSRLDERSSHIGQIADTIATLSRQTNLLALNASIEAARAGEHGRGFAVVASEIRKLAEGSAASAGQIAELLQEIRSDSTETVKAMQRVSEEVTLGSDKVRAASNSFQKILQATKEVAAQIQEVSAISEEMAAGSEEIAASVSDMANVARESLDGVQIVNDKTQTQTALVQEVSSLSEGLSREAENLETLVRKFTI
ncbi:methyl-accepting chemotaxis protein [Paenibacillus tyrfis]|uniref:methyl-accepting chemotaxis protein n=1 Tax=Paenibacillus tyrfis TaxID=1501230 RepID=UPI00068A6D06|nr:HAMP domain-containing methyl-accepting chemotaxis protein [Paenibacillus tyrfis]